MKTTIQKAGEGKTASRKYKGPMCNSELMHRLIADQEAAQLEIEARRFPSLMQSAEDQRRAAINEREEWNSREEEPDYNLRDDGRNPDGSGESYAERNT